MDCWFSNKSRIIFISPGDVGGRRGIENSSEGAVKDGYKMFRVIVHDSNENPKEAYIWVPGIGSFDSWDFRKLN